MEVPAAPAQLICRGVAVKDVPALFQLCRDLGYDPSQDGFGDRIRAVIERPGNAVFIAADAHEDTPVGFIHVFARPSIEIEPCAQIQALVVGEAARRRGAGALLMAAAEQWARAEGFTWMSLYCSSHRDAAHEFYEAQGFENVVTATRFNKTLT